MKGRLYLLLAVTSLVFFVSCLLLMTPHNIHIPLTAVLNSTLEPGLEVDRSPPEGEPLLDSLASCQNVTGPKSLPEQLRWDVLSIALAILQELSVPYLLESGSLLHLVRECGLGDSDLDVSVDSVWWRKGDNQARLQQAMEAEGLKRVTTFGDINKFGYEERYTILGVQLDVFASDSNRTQGEIWTAIWIGGFVYPCVMKIQSYVWYNWFGQQVRLPFPLEASLLSMYGVGYTKKASHPGYFTFKCKCDNSGLDQAVPSPGQGAYKGYGCTPEKTKKEIELKSQIAQSIKDT